LNSAAQGTARVPAARGRYPGADSYHLRFTPKALHNIARLYLAVFAVGKVEICTGIRNRRMLAASATLSSGVSCQLPPALGMP
jgi:hypothetical protein